MFKLQPNLVTRKPLFLDDKQSTVSDMPAFLFNLPYFAGPKQPRLGGGGGGGGAAGGGSARPSHVFRHSFMSPDVADVGLSSGADESVLQFRINKAAKVFVLWCEENELEKWCVGRGAACLCIPFHRLRAAASASAMRRCPSVCGGAAVLVLRLALVPARGR